MTTLINQIIPPNSYPQTEFSLFHNSTAHRSNLLFTPIQQTSNKQSDISAYFFTPVIDYFILQPAFILDFYIEWINSLASFAKAAYLWTRSQQQSDSLITQEVNQELTDVFNHGGNMVSSLLASMFNHFISALALVTRPIASLVHACTNNEPTQEAAPQENTFTLAQ